MKSHYSPTILRCPCCFHCFFTFFTFFTSTRWGVLVAFIVLSPFLHLSLPHGGVLVALEFPSSKKQRGTLNVIPHVPGPPLLFSKLATAIRSFEFSIRAKHITENGFKTVILILSSNFEIVSLPRWCPGVPRKRGERGQPGGPVNERYYA